jgi:hypothetical protein
MTTPGYLAKGFLLLAACLGALGLATIWLGPYGFAFGVSALAVALVITALHFRSSGMPAQTDPLPVPGVVERGPGERSPITPAAEWPAAEK